MQLSRQGCLPLVSLRSRQCVGDLKMAGTVRAAAFTADGSQLLTSGAPMCWCPFEAALWPQEAVLGEHLRICKDNLA